MAERAAALCIAGSDSSGAAGLQADLKTLQRFGVYGTTALTFVSAQDGDGVQALELLSPALVEAQIAAAGRQFHLGAVKTGALGGAEQVAAVRRGLETLDAPPLVVDPVFASSSGRALLSEDARAALVSDLLPRARLVTPNLPEACQLLDLPPQGLDDPDARRAALPRLLALGPRAVLLKGGHGGAPVCEDWLCDGDAVHVFRAPRRDTPHTRGTGCTYAAAIAAGLARGETLEDAVGAAHAFVQTAIAGAPGVTPRDGSPGPLDHFGSAP